MMQRASLNVEQLEDRTCPVVHSFSAATTHNDNPAAAGTAANLVVQQALGGTPAPVVASAGHAQGVPFQSTPPQVPGRN